MPETDRWCPIHPKRPSPADVPPPDGNRPTFRTFRSRRALTARYRSLNPQLSPLNFFPHPSIEHDRLVPVNQHAAFQVPAHRLGEHQLFEVAAFAHEVVHAVTMRHARDILVNDRAFIEVAG